MGLGSGSGLDLIRGRERTREGEQGDEDGSQRWQELRGSSGDHAGDWRWHCRPERRKIREIEREIREEVE